MDDSELAVRISTDVETLILEYGDSERDVRLIVEDGLSSALEMQE